MLQTRRSWKSQNRRRPKLELDWNPLKPHVTDTHYVNLRQMDLMIFHQWCHWRCRAWPFFRERRSLPGCSNSGTARSVWTSAGGRHQLLSMNFHEFPIEVDWSGMNQFSISIYISCIHFLVMMDRLDKWWSMYTSITSKYRWYQIILSLYVFICFIVIGCHW